jgi:uncharacterized protein (TIGR02172 family)
MGQTTATKGTIIGKGRASEVFTWGNDQVLKLHRDPRAGAETEREFHTTAAVHKAGLPVPAVDRMVEAERRPGIVFERIEGPTMSQAMLSAPMGLFKMAESMAEIHAAMHSCEVPDLPARRDRLEIGIRAAEALTPDTREEVLKALAQLPDGNAVCHGDLWPDNVIMSPRGPIIIDWAGAARGDPLADVARTWLLNRLTQVPIPLPERKLVNSMRALFHSAYLSRYLKLSRGSRKQIAAWLLPVVAARLHERATEEEWPKLLRFIEDRIS